MKVLSLFDGISCAKVAFERAGIPITSYKASEIDKHAIKVSQKNHPDIVHLGNVVDVSGVECDFLIGGSPCTDLSIAKKDREGLKGDRSKLFYEFVRILKESKPKWFILENVASMSKADKDTISAELGVQPIMINASLVSAQCRKRLFWTNIPDVKLPEDKGILLKDVLQEDAEVDERMVKDGKSYCLTATYNGATESNSVERKQRTMVRIGHIGKTPSIFNRVYSTDHKSPTVHTCGGSLIKVGHVGPTECQGNRVYSIEGKASTLSACGGGLGAKTGLYTAISGRESRRRLDDEGHRKDGDETVPIVRVIETRDDEKSSTLTTMTNHNLVVKPNTIRKLTPVECERLQCLPDNYTNSISNTQRYKCLGNAFNVDVVAHILTFLPNIITHV
jgi:DNA (cytosine-5)-methyltransferase 3A